MQPFSSDANGTAGGFMLQLPGPLADARGTSKGSAATPS